MQHNSIPQAAPAAMRALLSRARGVVLDLDGPVARVFAGEPAQTAAHRMLEIAEQDGCVVERLRGCTDPIAVLYGYTAEMEERNGRDGWDKAVAKMHDELDAYEWQAAASAEPTPGAEEFIRACWESGRSLSVATNNNTDAAVRILAGMNVVELFEGRVVGRSRDALLMKPHPWSLEQAMVEGVPAAGHLMIGDTATDYRAAMTAEMAFCGYHHERWGRERLGAAGAELITDSMRTLVSYV
ncbi:HAD family hydrolase [Streptomyces sp. NPDC004726]